jgi:hypothetical protein
LGLRPRTICMPCGCQITRTLWQRSRGRSNSDEALFSSCLAIEGCGAGRRMTLHLHGRSRQLLAIVTLNKLSTMCARIQTKRRSRVVHQEPDNREQGECPAEQKINRVTRYIAKQRAWALQWSSRGKGRQIEVQSRWSLFAGHTQRQVPPVSFGARGEPR